MIEPKCQPCAIIFCAGDFLNELSNDGAKDQFSMYLNEDIIPVMVHGARVSNILCDWHVSFHDPYSRLITCFTSYNSARLMAEFVCFAS